MSRLDAIAKAKPSDPGYGGRGREIRWIDQSTVMNLNIAAAPLEWLVAKGLLETKLDEPGHGMMRFAVAMHYRRVHEGAQVSALKGQSLEGSSGGSAGGRPVPDYKLDCMFQLDKIRSRLHPGLLRLVTMVVVDDIWMWEQPAAMKKRQALMRKLHTTINQRDRAKLEKNIQKEKKREQLYLIDKLLKGIDSIGVALGYITDSDFRQRWTRRRNLAAQNA